ncbi:hypothetical protein pipiens_015241 [Culex pipiens pipiens]|uniref:Uncharacterized protein n=1 Tax=Culex pipiens pipiens TaxID=38569 RepID=A0ABD1CRJ5_CULPP
MCPIVCWKSESSIYSATPSSNFQNADCQGACRSGSLNIRNASGFLDASSS